MKNKVVIITGASSGIGKALAEKFGREGSKIVITGRDAEKLAETENTLRRQNIEVLAVCADVSKEADNDRMVTETLARFGQIDILINNAGISMRALFENTDSEVIRRVMDINFFGAVYATKACLPHLLTSKGSVVGISSVAGHRGVPARTAYSASKFALNGFLEVLRTETLYRNLHVLTVSPGFIATNIRKTSLTADGSAQGNSPRDEGKMMSAETCADHVYRAVKNRKRSLVLTLQGKLTVLLNKFIPGIMDKIVYNVMAKEADSPFK